MEIKENEEKVKIDDSIEWVRYEEVFKSPLFKKENINPNYIKQGQLGDCYYVTALARLAMQPTIVEALFEKDIPNNEMEKVKDSIDLSCGAVVIYFWCHGRKTPVITDTRLPMKNGKLLFSSPIDDTKSAWFCLVEKAYAKLCGSYSSIVTGNISDGIYSLFGNYYPKHISINDLVDNQKSSNISILEKIMGYLNKKLDVVEAFIDLDVNKNGVTEEKLKEKGLVSDHSYLILKVRKVKALNGILLICLRNPWGHFEWNGDWSDKSPLWTPEAKIELKLEDKDDGTFWMNEKDFITYFTGINRSRVISKQMYSRRFQCRLEPNIKNKSKAAFKFICNEDDIKDDEKYKFSVLVEKRHEFYDENNNNTKYIEYAINFEHQNGNKTTMKKQFSKQNLKSFDEKASKNETVIISLERLIESNITEDCYVLVFSKYKFTLYNYNNPDEIYLLENNYGYIFAPTSFDNIDEQMAIIQKIENDKKINGENEIVEYDRKKTFENLLGNHSLYRINQKENNQNNLNEFLKNKIKIIEEYNSIEKEKLLQMKKDNEIELEKKDKELESIKRKNLKLNKQKKIMQDQLNKQKKIMQDQLNKQKKIMQDQLNKQKEMMQDQLNKQKEMMQDQLNKQKEMMQDQLNKQKNDYEKIEKDNKNIYLMYQKEKNEKNKLVKKNDDLMNQQKNTIKELDLIKKENEELKATLNKLRNKNENDDYQYYTLKISDSNSSMESEIEHQDDSNDYQYYQLQINNSGSIIESEIEHQDDSNDYQYYQLQINDSSSIIEREIESQDVFKDSVKNVHKKLLNKSKQNICVVIPKQQKSKSFSRFKKFGNDFE